MPLGNGEEVPPLFDERARFAEALHRTIRAEQTAQQENAPAGLYIQRSMGLHPLSVPEQAPPFAQQPAAPRGVLEGFIKTCQRWGLSEKQQLSLLGYGDNEFLGAQLLNGRWLRPSQDVKDRAGYVVGISIGLGAIFDEAIEAEVTWLNTAHPKLGGRTPLSVMLEGRMIALINVAGLVAEEREL